MGDSSLSIINIDDVQIIEAIKSATRRLVVIAPGLTLAVAWEVAAQWRNLGAQAVSVILDVEPEVCRMGYGEPEAFTLLQDIATKLGTAVFHQPGLRLGVVIADDTTLIYTPTPLVVEPSAPRPNGIRLNQVPAEIARDAGLDGQTVGERAIGTQPVNSEVVEAVTSDLKENPPRRFDLTQKVHVFNAAFEFVDFKLEGCAIERKTVRIPADLIGLGKDPRTQNMLRSTFRLISEDDEWLSGKKVMKLKEFISDKYLINLPKYGNVVMRTNKADFEKAIESLKRYVERFQERAKKQLQKAIDENRQTLLNALTPAVANNPPPRSIKHIGKTPNRELVREWLALELEKVFGTADSHLSHMEVSVIFKGVTYESLSDPEFIAVAKTKLPMLKQLHEEYETAKAIPESSDQLDLFSERVIDESSKAIN
jgi:hypothetical protein